LAQEETISEFYSAQLSDMSDINTEVLDSDVLTTSFCVSSRSHHIVYDELSSTDTSVCEIGELYDTLSTYRLLVLLVFPAVHPVLDYLLPLPREPLQMYQALAQLL